MTDINKVFQVRCPRCRWSAFSSGLKKDLVEAKLFEVKPCVSCNGERYIRCPKCGTASPLKRIAGNNEVKPPSPPPET
jgi:uncharacterized C2H2 Zn-finger protein